jgi:hypothetical protein
MRSQQNVRHNHRAKMTQFDLFAVSGGGVALTPTWQTLPEETRLALTRLVARLILDHARNAGAPQLEEARHDI